MSHKPGAVRILELGSGPGFLASHVLACLPLAEMVLLDHSAATHALARSRVSMHIDRVRFVERNFKEPDWWHALGSFHFVVTNQAVHELRHKRHARTLHEQVRPLLEPGGEYLVCDHYAGDNGMSNTELYMTVAEQRQALLEAGFGAVTELKLKGGLVLHSASAA
jgi:16S rRNA G1207 methylase RsmC